MNRTDRLLAIVLELQGKGRQRAEDLASTFETSKRTIYRDIQALGEAGVPLVAVPGRGYALMKGYFLPPLSFNTEEATMLLMGSDFMAQNFDAQYREAAQAASRKIEGVLPEKLREDVHYLQNSIRFIASGTIKDEREAEMLRQLRRAIIEQTTVRFCYHTRYAQSDTNEQRIREADPYGLVHINNKWLLVAYCYWRKDVRNFRLDRVDTLELLSTTFVRPPDFKMEKRKDEEQKSLLIRALFDAEVARWVLESRSYYMTAAEETAEGLLVTLKARQENEVLQWLLSWGRHVRVLEPVSVRKRLLEEAKGMMEYYEGVARPG